jgi:hypothetical protein
MTNIVVKFNPGGGLQQTSTPITLKNTIDTSQRLDRLFDVVADTDSTPSGSTLVYDPVTDKYIVKLLDLDGGSF